MNKDINGRLISSLDALLGKFNQGIVPGDPEKSNALHMLEAYKEALKNFHKTQKLSFRRVEKQTEAFDENSFYEELSGYKAGILLLLKLGMEKLISKEELIFQTEVGKVLIDGNYCDEIIFEESGKHYYSLSKKGEKALKNKNFIEQIRNLCPTAVIPSKMILDTKKWGDLYAKRIEVLNTYYAEKKEEKDYILFTLDEAKEMVFGCEINNSLEVTYAFAGVFDENISEHIELLKRYADSGLVDRILIIIHSKEQLASLEKEGINSTNIPRITIEQI